jgi:tetratricopeptide (TPR) repeat protein
LYTISVVLIYWFLLKLNINFQLAGWLTLIFAVHPLNAPAAAWIFGRNEPLLAIFLILSLLALKTYADKNKFPALILHLLLYAACLYTKETAVVFPVLAAAFLWIYFPGQTKKIIAGAVGWTIITAIWFISRQGVLKQFVNKDIIGWEAFVHNWKSIFLLTGKMFVPIKLQLNAYYDNTFIIGIVVFVLLLSLVLMNKTDRKVKLFGLLWLVAFMLPPMILISVNVDFDYALHRAFIPMIGVIIIIAKVIEERKIKTKIFTYAFATIAVLLLFITERSLPVYRNSVSFWNNLPATYPEQQDAYAVAGGVFFNTGHSFEANELFVKGINAPVKSSKLFYNLGIVATSRKEYSKAEEYYKKAIEINPKDTMAIAQLNQVEIILKDSVSRQ